MAVWPPVSDVKAHGVRTFGGADYVTWSNLQHVLTGESIICVQIHSARAAERLLPKAQTITRVCVYWHVVKSARRDGATSAAIPQEVSVDTIGESSSSN